MLKVKEQDGFAPDGVVRLCNLELEGVLSEQEIFHLGITAVFWKSKQAGGGQNAITRKISLLLKGQSLWQFWPLFSTPFALPE